MLHSSIRLNYPEIKSDFTFWTFFIRACEYFVSSSRSEEIPSFLRNWNTVVWCLDFHSLWICLADFLERVGDTLKNAWNMAENHVKEKWRNYFLHVMRMVENGRHSVFAIDCFICWKLGSSANDRKTMKKSRKICRHWIHVPISSAKKPSDIIPTFRYEIGKNATFSVLTLLHQCDFQRMCRIVLRFYSEFGKIIVKASKHYETFHAYVQT